jgi:hypothetical protein
MGKTPDKFNPLVSDLILILFWVACFVAPAAFAEDEWKILGLSSKGTLFYNSETLTALPAGKKAVGTKFVFNEEGRRLLKSRGGKFAGAAYVTVDYEINCPAWDTKCRSGFVYSREGESLGPLDCSGEGSGRAMIFPESLSGEVLLKKFCP